MYLQSKSSQRFFGRWTRFQNSKYLGKTSLVEERKQSGCKGVVRKTVIWKSAKFWFANIFLWICVFFFHLKKTQIWQIIVSAETIDSGRLREGTIKKNDQPILVHDSRQGMCYFRSKVNTLLNVNCEGSGCPFFLARG